MQIGIFTHACDPNLLFDSFQESEVQIVLIAIKESFVVGEDKVSGIVAPPDAFQLNVGLVPTFSAGAKLHAHIFVPRLESTAAGIQTVMDLRVKPVGSVINKTLVSAVSTCICAVMGWLHVHLWLFIHQREVPQDRGGFSLTPSDCGI